MCLCEVYSEKFSQPQFAKLISNDTQFIPCKSSNLVSKIMDVIPYDREFNLFSSLIQDLLDKANVINKGQRGRPLTLTKTQLVT